MVAGEIVYQSPIPHPEGGPVYVAFDLPRKLLRILARSLDTKLIFRSSLTVTDREKQVTYFN